MSDRKLNPDPDPDPDPGTKIKTVVCPSCKTPVPESVKTFPFCSSRCKSVDLGRWFNESFKISRPIEQADLEEDD